MTTTSPRRMALGLVAAGALAFALSSSAVATPARSVRISLGGVRAMLAEPAAAARLHNVMPSPDYFNVCASRGENDKTCIAEELAAIRNARRQEHVKRAKMILPSNYRKLSVAEQTFVITDLERVDRGLRPLAGLSASLDSVSHAAAVAHADPMLASVVLHTLHVYSYGSIWAGDLGPLASDYDWMYNDGYSKTNRYNLDCTTPDATGCWGHRDNILFAFKPSADFPNLIAGAGTSTPAGASIAEVLAGANGKSPKLVYTWKQALAHGANGHRVHRR